MTLFENDAAVLRVLQKYRIVDGQGKPTQTVLEKGNLGKGPLLSADVVNRFASLDTTANKKILDWMLLQAGGGQEAKQTSVAELENAKNLFVQENVDGYADSNGEDHPPISQEEAEALWHRKKSEFEPEFMVGDEDMMERYDSEIFGYWRNWPGRDGIYKRVFEAVQKFLENVSAKEGNQSRISMVNQGRRQRAGAEKGTFEPVKTSIDQFKTLDELEEFNDEFFYFFKKRTAVKDVRSVTVYDDKIVTALLPQTIAASIEHGLSNWCVANKTEFDTAFHHSKSSRRPPHWQSYTVKGPFIYFKFKVPVPEGMHVLAAHIKYDNCNLKDLKPPFENVEFYDRENRSGVKWPDVIVKLKEFTQMTAKAEKPQAPEAGGQPVSAGPPARPLVRSMTAAMKAVSVFFRDKFNNEMVRSNPYEAHARQLANALLA